MTGSESDLAVIERRIASVRAVRQVIHAIHAMALAQLPFAEEAAADAWRYLEWLAAAVARVVRERAAIGPAGALHVIFGPERPYCGGLPRRILAQAPAAGDLGLVGHRLAEVADADPALAPRVRFRLPGAVSHDEPGVIVERIAAAILEHAGSRPVKLHHPLAGGAELAGVPLLSGAPERLSGPPETFSPLAEVLDAAVRELVAGRLAVGVAEALRSEVRARVAAADAARRACDDHLERLGARWRAARQEQITSELLDIVGARAATLGRP